MTYKQLKDIKKLFYSYGNPIVQYKGNGYLTLLSNEKISCVFEVSQFSEGHIIIICQVENYFVYQEVVVLSFEGVTENDLHISSNIKFQFRRARPAGKNNILVFEMYEFSLKVNDKPQVSAVAYGITNFKFFPVRSIPISFNRDETINAIIKPINGYSETVDRLSITKGIEITCEIIIPILSMQELVQSEDIIDNICHILSIANGTKIQWIYRNIYSEKELVLKQHYWHVTRPYSGLNIIDYSRPQDIKYFIDISYQNYVNKKDLYELDKGTIDHYLDAKSEQDYLESRGAKLAVTLEKLKSVFINLSDVSKGEFILEESRFNDLIPKLKNELKKFLKNENIESAEREVIYKKIPELNRRPFSELIENVFSRISLELPKEDIKLFIECRNSLVHQGKFYCQVATLEQRIRCSPLPSVIEEYLFMLNFIDKIFLRILGYDGPYLDWKGLKVGFVLNGPTRRESVV